MRKKYIYKERIIIQFEDKTRASYSYKLYGNLLEEVAEQSFLLGHKVQNLFKKEGEIVKIYFKDWETFTIIDTEDFDKVRNIHWSINHNGYVYSRQGGKTLYLHRIISGYRDEDYPELVVDHKDNNPLNNRKNNLRIVSQRENATNKKNQENMGVNKHHHNGSWRARWVDSTGKKCSKNFSGQFAKERAAEYRLQKIKENGYLRTFND